MVSLYIFSGNSTGVYILPSAGMIGLTIIVFYAIVSFIAVMFCYIISLTYIRMNHSLLSKSLETTLRPINRLFSIFLIFLPWIIIIPILDITLGFSICTEYAYIVTYRTDCRGYPIIWSILGGIGNFLASCIGISITIFYRNYEFNEKEILKRKYSHTSVLMYIFCTLHIFSFWTRVGFNYGIATVIPLLLGLIY